MRISFDDFSKALASDSSRREFLKGIGISAITVGLGSVGFACDDPTTEPTTRAEPGFAKGGTCRAVGAKCTTNAQCCTGVCTPGTKNKGGTCGCGTTGTYCAAGNVCIACAGAAMIVNQTTCSCTCPGGALAVCTDAPTAVGGCCGNSQTCCKPFNSAAGEVCCSTDASCCGNDQGFDAFCCPPTAPTCCPSLNGNPQCCGGATPVCADCSPVDPINDRPQRICCPEGATCCLNASNQPGCCPAGSTCDPVLGCVPTP